MRTKPVSHLVLAALILVGAVACRDEKEGAGVNVVRTGGSSGSGGRRAGGSGGQSSSNTGGSTSTEGGSGGYTASGGSGGSTGGSGGSTETDATPVGDDATPGDTAEEEVPVAPLCTSTTGGIGDDGLIDNFDDGNPEILARDGRMGGWWVAVGATTMVTGVMSPGGPPTNATGGRTGRALHIVGKESNPMSTWAMGVTGTVVADGMNGCYDAAQYKSLKIALKGKVGTKVYVYLLTAPVRAMSADAGHYRREVTLTAAWQEHTIRFMPDLMPSWGTPPPLDVTKVYGVDVSPVITPTSTDFDFWVDDVAFAK